MKHIKKFNTHDAYTAFIVGSSFVRPNISKCILESKIHYNKWIPPHYNVLDILYANSDGDKKVDINILNPSEGYIPIGLCVAATGFFGNNEPARFMSLKYMNCNTPNNGSLTYQYIRFSNDEDHIYVDNINKVYKNLTNAGYLTAEWITTMSNKIPSLFDNSGKWNLSELGEKNQYAVTDIDGKTKTSKYLLTATAQENWKTDTTILNYYTTGYYPAVCCCWRYHTLGTQQGDWYLPAAGELSMIAVQKNEINNKLLQISNIYNNYCINSIIDDYCYTSTEYNSNDIFRIKFTDGSLRETSKHGSDYVISMIQY